MKNISLFNHKKTGFAACIIFFAVSTSCLFSPANGIESKQITKWQVLYNQNKSIDKIKDEKGWQDIDVSSLFRLPYPGKHKFRYVWLKGEIEIDEPGRYHGISFGRIHHLYEIFLNGKSLDFKKETEIGNLHQPVNYIIYDGLKKGKNIIYIYLGIFGIEFGGLPDGVTIQTRYDYINLKKWQDFIYYHLPLGVTILMSIGAFVLATLFLMERKEKYFLYTSIMLLFEAFYVFSIYSNIKFMEFISILYILAITGPSFGIFFILIIQSLYRIKLNEYNKIIFPVIILSSIIALYIKETTFNFYVIPVTALFGIIAFILYASYLAYQLDKIKPDKVKCIGTISLINLIGFSAVFEVYFYLTGSVYSLIINVYFSPFMIIGFAVLGFRDFQRRIIELRVLYDRLRKRNENSKRNISDTTEDKIKTAIEFINENYKTEIYRKDIAAAVDMNVNYFSSKFKEYTGKKINDFINELRIKVATEMLTDKDVRVVDVAFSIGFDSLATFNRVFRTIMGTNPTEYRKGLELKNEKV